MRTPIVRVPSTGAVAGIQHWRCVAMISHKENQAFSSSNHMQRVEARATVLGKLQSQARLFLITIGVANRTAPQPPLLCVVVYHTFGQAGAPSQTAQACSQANKCRMYSKGAPSRWPTSSRPIDAGWRVPPPRCSAHRATRYARFWPSSRPARRIRDFLWWLEWLVR